MTDMLYTLLGGVILIAVVFVLLYRFSRMGGKVVAGMTALLVILVLATGGSITRHWLWLPVLGVLELAFVCGLALISSAFNVYVRDTRYAVESINAVTKTIADERIVVTMTPARIKRSGEIPARPRARR